MDFGDALKYLKDGGRVARAGWNGRNMWLVLVAQWTHDGVKDWPGERLPFLAMRTAQGDLVPWLASQTDILALDWSTVER